MDSPIPNKLSDSITPLAASSELQPEIEASGTLENNGSNVAQEESVHALEKSTLDTNDTLASLTDAAMKLELNAGNDQGPTLSEMARSSESSGLQTGDKEAPETSKGLTLLETGAPLVIPKLQVRICRILWIL
jgi:hypothetical protein